MQAESVFVYGTLKSDQIRASMWPRKPVQIQKAFTTGSLFDLGDYPALIPGSDRIGGEIWSFQPSDMAVTLQVLDEIEDFQQPNRDDLYVREVIACQSESNLPIRAFVYYYVQLDDLRNLQPMRPNRSGIVVWPENS